MYIDGNPVFHLIHDDTQFSAAQFLPKISSISIWECILTCWDTVYTGLPNKFTVDQGSQFQKTFAELAALQDVKVVQTGIQSQNVLGIGESYHSLLRNTYINL